MKKIFFSLLILLIIATVSCDKEDDKPEDNTHPLAPKITSITSDKDTIISGPEDPATITCVATGDNLEYLWDVALGNLDVVDSLGGSVVIFTAADCCEGDREIKCTVSNEYGKTDSSVKIHVNVIYP